jgi:hypothetical protein
VSSISIKSIGNRDELYIHRRKLCVPLLTGNR